MNHRYVLLGVALLFLAGCSVPFMGPQRKLNSGDLVMQGSLDLPGFSIIPKASAGLTYGFGGGDIGAHAGTSLILGHASARGRLYLDPAVISLEAGAITNFTELPFTGNRRLGFVTSTLRAGRLVPSSLDGALDGLYGGGEITALLPYVFDSDGDDGTALNLEYPLGTLGVYGGYEYPITNALFFQVELSFRGLGIGRKLDGGGADITPLVWPQVGISMQYTF